MAKTIWDEITPDTQAFSPENRLIMATGPLTRTLLLSRGKLHYWKDGESYLPPS
ncbi:MAG TPA: hypothetical protein GXX40_05275 [Firmicutes bacterium]|nr:hypothetical protein [Bacillota bacterium]